MKEISKKVLIVDDEKMIAEAIEAYLQNSGYKVLTAYDRHSALKIFEDEKPDLIILDLMLPDILGEEVCKTIRKNSRVPIIMLTAKVDEDSVLYGLDIGADDYITKPFSPRQLVARVGAMLRRTEGVAPLFNTMTWRNDDLVIDFDTHVVKKASQEVNLTPNEFKLLCSMVKYPKKVFTREELIIIAFGDEYEGYERTIDSHIKNLRRKIETDTSKPEYILTVHGIGYKFGGA